MSARPSPWRRAIARFSADLRSSARRAQHFRKPDVLVYADSRGLNLADPKQKTKAGTYAVSLARQNRIRPMLCPHSHTTLVDFLNLAETEDLSKYAAVIVHCGIVDFSPRPLSNIKRVEEGKRGLRGFPELFIDSAPYYAAPSAVEYHGELTQNLYSPEYLTASLIPRLQRINNLIWISSNPFVTGWEGNYERGRPANIAEYVERFDRLMIDALPNAISLRDWTDAEVRARTIDNIHFTRDGFDVVASLIQQRLDDVVDAR